MAISGHEKGTPQIALFNHAERIGRPAATGPGFPFLREAQTNQPRRKTEMFLANAEDIALARMADYERLVARLLLEKEARAASAEESARTRADRRRLLPWMPGRRSHGPAV